jgi:hypothetical protein
MKRLTVFTMIILAMLIYSTSFCGGDDPKTTPTPDPTATPTPDPTVIPDPPTNPDPTPIPTQGDCDNIQLAKTVKICDIGLNYGILWEPGELGAMQGTDPVSNSIYFRHYLEDILPTPTAPASYPYLHIHAENDVCIHQDVKIGEMMTDDPDAYNGALEVQKTYTEKPTGYENKTVMLSGSISSVIMDFPENGHGNSAPDAVTYTIADTNLNFLRGRPEVQWKNGDTLTGDRTYIGGYGELNWTSAVSDRYYKLNSNENGVDIFEKTVEEPDGIEFTESNKNAEFRITQICGLENGASLWGRISDMDSEETLDAKKATMIEGEGIYISPVWAENVHGLKNVAYIDSLDAEEGANKIIGGISFACASFNNVVALVKGSKIHVDEIVCSDYRLDVTENNLFGAPLTSNDWGQRENGYIGSYTGILIDSPNITDGKTTLEKKAGLIVQDFCDFNKDRLYYKGSRKPEESGDDGKSIISRGSVKLGDSISESSIGTDVTVINDILELTPRKNHPPKNDLKPGMVWVKKSGSISSMYLYNGSSITEIETDETTTITPIDYKCVNILGETQLIFQDPDPEDPQDTTIHQWYEFLIPGKPDPAIPDQKALLTLVNTGTGTKLLKLEEYNYIGDETAIDSDDNASDVYCRLAVANDSTKAKSVTIRTSYPNPYPTPIPDPIPDPPLNPEVMCYQSIVSILNSESFNEKKLTESSPSKIYISTTGKVAHLLELFVSANSQVRIEFNDDVEGTSDKHLSIKLYDSIQDFIDGVVAVDEYTQEPYIYTHETCIYELYQNGSSDKRFIVYTEYDVGIDPIFKTTTE